MSGVSHSSAICYDSDQDHYNLGYGKALPTIKSVCPIQYPHSSWLQGLPPEKFATELAPLSLPPFCFRMCWWFSSAELQQSDGESPASHFRNERSDVFSIKNVAVVGEICSTFKCSWGVLFRDWPFNPMNRGCLYRQVLRSNSNCTQSRLLFKDFKSLLSLPSTRPSKRAKLQPTIRARSVSRSAQVSKTSYISLQKKARYMLCSSQETQRRQNATYSTQNAPGYTSSSAPPPPPPPPPPQVSRKHHVMRLAVANSSPMKVLTPLSEAWYMSAGSNISCYVSIRMKRSKILLWYTKKVWWKPYWAMEVLQKTSRFRPNRWGIAALLIAGAALWWAYLDSKTSVLDLLALHFDEQLFQWSFTSSVFLCSWPGREGANCISGGPISQTYLPAISEDLIPYTQDLSAWLLCHQEIK